MTAAVLVQLARCLIPTVICLVAGAQIAAHMGKHHRITRCIRSKIDM